MACESIFCQTSRRSTISILHGNVRQNPKLSGTPYNVFGIQVGVGITVAIRKTKSKADRDSLPSRAEKTGETRTEADAVPANAGSFELKWKALSSGSSGTHGSSRRTARIPSLFRSETRQAERQRRSEPKPSFKISRSAWPHIATRSSTTSTRDMLASRIAEASSTTTTPKLTDTNARAAVHPRIHSSSTTPSFGMTISRDNLKRGRYAEFVPDRFAIGLYRPFSRRFLYLRSSLECARLWVCHFLS